MKRKNQPSQLTHHTPCKRGTYKNDDSDNELCEETSIPISGTIRKIDGSNDTELKVADTSIRIGGNDISISRDEIGNEVYNIKSCNGITIRDNNTIIHIGNTRATCRKRGEHGVTISF